MKLLHLCRTDRAFRERSFGGGQRLVESDDDGVVSQHDGYRLGQAAGSLELVVAGGTSDLFSHAWGRQLYHSECLLINDFVYARNKKADVAKHHEMFHHVGLLFNEPS